MVLDFYYVLPSPPCRGPMMVAKALGVELNLKWVDMAKAEHMTAEYAALNPAQKVPTLVDEDFPVCESKAIIGYLVGKYGKDDSLYPTNPKKRAVVDRFLYYDAGLQSAFIDYARPIVRFRQTPDKEKLEKILDTLHHLESHLKKSGFKFVTGDSVCVADHALIVHICSFKEIGMDLSSHPQVEAYIQHCAETMPGYEEICLAGAKMLQAMLKQIIGTN